MGYKAIFMGYFRGYSNDLKRFELDLATCDDWDDENKTSDYRMGTGSNRDQIAFLKIPQICRELFFLSPDLRGLSQQFSLLMAINGY